jgi:hemerythrin-like domain-containing protein
MVAATLSNAPAAVGRDGFAALDACHRQMLAMLDTLAALVTHLEEHGDDEHVRAMAEQVVRFFSTTARRHHEDEERHIFPRVVMSSDPEVVHTVLRLQQDHRWLEEDWMELSAHLQALAAGQAWWDLALLREGCDIFIALSREHIALEEACIYPEARERMPPAERRDMGRLRARPRRERRGRRA